MTSEDQIKANQENAQHSTGPLNTENSRFNALKHGLLSREIVVPKIESREEYEEVGTHIRDCLRPSDTIEEILVERVIVLYWRLRRAVRAENGLIQYNYVPPEPPVRYYTSVDTELLMGKVPDTAQETKLKETINQLKGEAAEHYKNIPTIDSRLSLLQYETGIERRLSKALKELYNYRLMKK